LQEEKKKGKKEKEKKASRVEELRPPTGKKRGTKRDECACAQFRYRPLPKGEKGEGKRKKGGTSLAHPGSPAPE